jgi:hypothetical protein
LGRGTNNFSAPPDATARMSSTREGQEPAQVQTGPQWHVSNLLSLTFPESRWLVRYLLHTSLATGLIATFVAMHGVGIDWMGNIQSTGTSKLKTTPKIRPAFMQAHFEHLAWAHFL